MQQVIDAFPVVVLVVGVLAGLVSILRFLGKDAPEIWGKLRPPARPRVGTVKRLDEDTDVDFATKVLRTEVEEHWKGEADHRGLLKVDMRITWSVDQARIPLKLTNDRARRQELDLWDGRTTAVDGHDDAPSHEPTVDHLAAFYRDIRPDALVVLGSAASGKSAAAVLLTLGLLEKSGEANEPVPVHFSLARWDSHEPDFVHWLTRQLLLDHPWLRAADHYGADAAGQLLRAGRILPVLDGLDEIGDDQRSRIIDAIKGSPVSLPGLILTCRPDRYEETEEGGEWLPGVVVVVRLAGVEPGNAVAYLKGSLPGIGDQYVAKWEPVFSHLAANPDGPLAKALRSPLMVFLVARIYRGARSAPERLLAFETQAAIEEHLLEQFVPAVFHGTPGSRGGRWRSEDARAWLGNLAALMGTDREIGWWELSKRGRPGTRVLAALLAAVTAFASVGLAVTVLFDSTWGVRVGGVVALLLAAAAARNDPPAPSEIEVHVTDRLRSIVLSGVLIGGIVFVVGTVIRDVRFGAGAGVAFGLPIAVLYGMTGTDPKARPADPGFLFRRDLRVGITFGLAYGVPASVIGWWLTDNGLVGLALGVACALAAGLLYGPIWLLALKGNRVGVVAFAHLAIAEAWFAPRHRLPWHVMHFLDDAHQLGVIRVAGGKYEFRHELLQAVLAAESRGQVPRAEPAIALPAQSPPDASATP